MSDAARDRVHGTAIAVAGKAALIRGASGAGKSDLALRCLALPVGPFTTERPLLVADDQVEIELRQGRLIARSPSALRGLIEVRGIGIVTVPIVEEAELVVVIDLVGAADIERLPAETASTEILGVGVRCVSLAPFESSAPVKLLLALCQRLNMSQGAT